MCTRRVCPESRFPHLLCYPLIPSHQLLLNLSSVLLLCSQGGGKDPFRVFTQSHHSAKPRQWLPRPLTKPAVAGRLSLSAALLTLAPYSLPSPSALLTLACKAQAHCVFRISTYSFLFWESLLLGNMPDGLSKSSISFQRISS